MLLAQIVFVPTLGWFPLAGFWLRETDNASPAIANRLQPPAALFVLVVLKIIADLHAHIQEHSKIARPEGVA